MSLLLFHHEFWEEVQVPGISAADAFLVQLAGAASVAVLDSDLDANPAEPADVIDHSAHPTATVPTASNAPTSGSYGVRIP